MTPNGMLVRQLRAGSTQRRQLRSPYRTRLNVPMVDRTLLGTCVLLGWLAATAVAWLVVTLALVP